MVGKRKKKLGFAFVQFTNIFDAAKALQGMNQKDIKGRPIAVDWTLPKKKYELWKIDEDTVKNEDNKNVIAKHADDKNDGENNDDMDDDNDETEDDNDDMDDDNDNSIDVDNNSIDEDGKNIDDDDGVGDDDDDGDHIGNDDPSDDIDDENEESDDETPVKKKRKLRDAREGKTIFIRNLPFDASEEEISALFKEFGEVEYSKIVVDSVTEHSRGSAFLKFKEKESADSCLKKYAENHENSEDLIMRKRPLSITLAVTKGKIPQLLAEKDGTKKAPRDKRNLYLAKEGVLLPGSEAAAGLSKSDLKKRQKAEEEKKAKLKMPHYVVSKTRLCLRNLPLNVDDKKLAQVLRSVCEGKPKIVRKVKIMRNMERLDGSGIARSKGFGFAEFFTHEDALEVLRATNNNPTIFGPERRPIVEFAIENSLILRKLEQRTSKNLQKAKRKEVNDASISSGKNKRKHELSGENKRRKKLKKDKNANFKSPKDAEMKTAQGNSEKQLEPNRNVPNHKTKIRTNSKMKLKNWKPNFKSEERNEQGILKEGIFKSRAKQKRREKVNKEEQKFNEIVEKYKTKLFGENSKQLKNSRWFNS